MKFIYFYISCIRKKEKEKTALFSQGKLSSLHLFFQGGVKAELNENIINGFSIVYKPS